LPSRGRVKVVVLIKASSEGWQFPLSLRRGWSGVSGYPESDIGVRP
jgi:hypothetical protein